MPGGLSLPMPERGTKQHVNTHNFVQLELPSLTLLLHLQEASSL